MNYGVVGDSVYENNKDNNVIMFDVDINMEMRARNGEDEHNCDS